MGRSVAAVIAGYFLMVALMFVYLPALMTAFGIEAPGPDAESPRPELPNALLALLLVCDFVAAVLAGMVCAWIGRHSAVRHGAVLAGLTLILGGVQLLFTAGQEPIVYAAPRTVGAPLFIVLGAWLMGRLGDSGPTAGEGDTAPSSPESPEEP